MDIINSTTGKYSYRNTYIKFIVLLIFWIAAFYPVLPELIHAWLHTTNDSYGILVPFISVYIIWKKRDILKKIQLSSMASGFWVLAISMIFYVFAYAGSVAVMSRFMIVFSLIGLVMFTLGKEAFSEIKFPIFFLLFMIPVPVSIYTIAALPLQLFATKASCFVIQSLGIPAYREGNMLYFAQTQLEVAQACSGLRSIMAFIMLGFLFSYLLDNRSFIKSGVLIISTVPLAIFTNILRVTGTGILANFYGAEFAQGFLHEFSGMVVFALGFILLFYEYIILNKKVEK